MGDIHVPIEEDITTNLVLLLSRSSPSAILYYYQDPPDYTANNYDPRWQLVA